MSTRTLIEFDPLASDGCSSLAALSHLRLVPKDATKEAQLAIIKAWFGEDWRAAVRACICHDRRYYLGGSTADRKRADVELRLAWLRIEGGNLWERASRRAFIETGYVAIRAFGGPEAKTPGVSWAYGGQRFEYTDEPAIEVVDGAETEDRP